MLDVILVSNYSMKDELKESLQENNVNFYDLMIQDIQHIERYPIDDEYKTIIIQSANAIKKIDSSNNHIYNAEKIYGIGPNCRAWVSKKFSLDCTIPDNDYSSIGLIEKIEKENNALGKTLLLKGIGGKNIIKEYLDDRKINYSVRDVYERVLNRENLDKVIEVSKNGAIIIGFSKSSVEPLLDDTRTSLKELHFMVLDKSDENIVNENQVKSLTKINDIYDIEALTNALMKINV